VERVHQVIGDAICSMELCTNHCDDATIHVVLQNVAYGLRATYHSSIAASPGQLVFGRDMVINSIYLAYWKNHATRQQTQIHHNNYRAVRKDRINDKRLDKGIKIDYQYWYYTKEQAWVELA
jgi:hypothetical protein